MKLCGSTFLVLSLVPMLFGAMGGASTERASIVLLCPSSTPCGWNNVVEVKESGTHIVSSSNGNSPSRDCEIIFPKPNVDICQVRLDFVNFDLPQPSGNGNCDDGSFTVSAENLGEFQTCGIAKGQHLYLHYGNSDTVTANFNIKTGNVQPSFDILATHIPCATFANSKDGRSFLRSNSTENITLNYESNVNAIDNEPAPMGCDQYYTSSSGEVRSFNYIRPGSNPAQSQINTERYTACIRTPPGSKRIIWETCTNEVFSISGFGDKVSRTGSDCSLDYVDIPGSPGGRYCGGAFPDVVTSTARPFLMYVHLDDQEDYPFDQNIVNPLTGCPAGYDCTVRGSVIPVYGPPPFADATLPCGTPEAIRAGEHCLPEDGFPLDGGSFNPLTGCPIGCNCVSIFGSPIFPGDPDADSILPCGSDAYTYCLPAAGFFGFLDFNNAGFCLKYAVV